MQKTWWVVNGERSDVASSYSGARHSWPANCTAVCCITALHCYHCHHRSAVQCDSNVKWSGLCYNWASCDHMYDCRAFIIEYQELCRAVLSWLQGISWVHQGGRLSWGAGGTSPPLSCYLLWLEQSPSNFLTSNYHQLHWPASSWDTRISAGLGAGDCRAFFSYGYLLHPHRAVTLKKTKHSM